MVQVSCLGMWADEKILLQNFPDLEVNWMHKKMYSVFHLVCIFIQSSNIMQPSGKAFWILKEHRIYSPPRTGFSHHGELYTRNQLKIKKKIKKKEKKITSKRIKQCSQLCTGLEGQERSVNSQLWQLQNNYPSSEHLVLQLPGFPQESSSVLVQIGKRVNTFSQD